MKYLPKILGAIALVSGNVAVACLTNYPKIAFWSGVVATNATALGVFLSRNHSTSDEQAGAGVTPPKSPAQPGTPTAVAARGFMKALLRARP